MVRGYGPRRNQIILPQVSNTKVKGHSINHVSTTQQKITFKNTVGKVEYACSQHFPTF